MSENYRQDIKDVAIEDLDSLSQAQSQSLMQLFLFEHGLESSEYRQEKRKNQFDSELPLWVLLDANIISSIEELHEHQSELVDDNMVSDLRECVQAAQVTKNEMQILLRAAHRILNNLQEEATIIAQNGLYLDLSLIRASLNQLFIEYDFPLFN